MHKNENENNENSKDEDENESNLFDGLMYSHETECKATFLKMYATENNTLHNPIDNNKSKSTQRLEAKLASILDDLSIIHNAYKVTEPYNNKIESLLSFIVNAPAHLPFAKGNSRRVKQMDAIVNLCNKLQVQDQQSMDDLITLSKNLNIYEKFKDEGCNLSTNTQAKIVTFVKMLLLYGKLNRTTFEIEHENNLLPSRLEHLVNNKKRALEIELQHFDLGVIYREQIAMLSEKAYAQFISADTSNEINLSENTRNYFNF